MNNNNRGQGAHPLDGHRSDAKRPFPRTPPLMKTHSSKMPLRGITATRREAVTCGATFGCSASSSGASLILICNLMCIF